MKKRSLTPDQEIALLQDKINNPHLLMKDLATRYGISISTVSRLVSSYYGSIEPGFSYTPDISTHVYSRSAIRTSYRKLSMQTIQELCEKRDTDPNITLKALAYHYGVSIATLSRILRKHREHQEGF